MCLYSRLIPNPKFKENKKNGGHVPAVNDPRTIYVPIGCGQCIECRKQKARSWQIRLLEDIKTNTNGKFVTLTFSNEKLKELMSYRTPFTHINRKTGEITEKYITDYEGYELDNKIATLAIRLFVERWRKKFKKSIRHWLVTEIGHKGTENIHLHGIIWTNEPLSTVEQYWQYGWVWKGDKIYDKLTNYVNQRTISYIVKYIHKIDQKHKTFKSKILTSAGIGANYTKTTNSKQNKYNNSETNETYRTNTGHKIALPIYWRNKIYTDDEKEKLWIQKLNKEERWICGEKVDISKTDQQYHNILQFHRQRNAELGYGTGDTLQNTKEYEHKRRLIMHETRIRKAKQQPPRKG